MLFEVDSQDKMTDEETPRETMTNWKQLFRNKLIARNKQYFQQNAHKVLPREQALQRFRLFMQVPVVKETHEYQLQTYPHHQFTSYVPLKQCKTFDNEITSGFPFLRNIAQEDCLAYLKKFNQRSISTQMLPHENWKELKDYLNPRLTVTEAVNIFLASLKFGVKIIKKRHQELNPNCLLKAFIHKIKYTGNRYCKTQGQSYQQSFGLPVDKFGQISLFSLSVSKKKHFCALCMIYGCERHSLPKIVIKNSYQYVNPYRDPKIQITTSFKLFKHLKHTLQDGYKNQEDQCGPDCYMLVDKTALETLITQRRPFHSPLYKVMLDLGIVLYGFDCCRISELFEKANGVRKVSCMSVFLYLLIDYDLKKKIFRKFYLNESAELLDCKQYRDYTEVLSVETKLTQNERRLVYHPQKYESICYHHFSQQEPNDVDCLNCQCRLRGYCLPECQCSILCRIPYTGCSCKKMHKKCSQSKCPCIQKKKACLKDVCYCIPWLEGECKNSEAIIMKPQITRIGLSDIPNAGLGIFAARSISKNYFIGTYLGEIIRNISVQSLRQTISNSVYTFYVSEGITIDAKYYGNKSRFMNHAHQKRENVKCQKLVVRADTFVVFYSLQYIKKGQELCFDYNSGGTFTNFSGKYSFIDTEF